MSVQFPSGPTRNVQAGDTPDLNDGLLSRPSSIAIIRGGAYVIDPSDGLIKVPTDTLVGTNGAAPFVPIEALSAVANQPVSGVGAPQRVALTFEANTTLGLNLYPGDYVMVDASLDTDTNVGRWTPGALSGNPKYARFLGIEAALLETDDATPYGESLTEGVVPDQAITGLADGDTKVGWFQLLENGIQ